MFRKIAIVAVLLVVLAAMYASAANLTVGGGTIQAGIDASLYCDVDGVLVDGWGLETNTNSVTYVRINDISSDCLGSAMFIKVLDGGGAVLASSTVNPITSSTHTFNFPAIDANAIEQLAVWIEGGE